MLEIFTSVDEADTRKKVDQDGFGKPESNIEHQWGNGQGKGISSSSSSHPQMNEKKVPNPCQIVIKLVLS